ncbi:MAG TPA: COR domain-containing protein, partial [Anaerolineales bacterium]|nr:COR domain-containing protein [Anaerolineales bacterium]
TFDDHEDSTFIVEKRPLPLGDVRAQVWDFGGQEHMHATHQFFFSGRSLYLLVFDTGKTLEQNNIEYWLTLINAYSQNAPVILVGNKCDQHEMDVEKRRLREKYPNIRGFVGTSASTGEHIAELRQKIQEEVRAMPQVRVLFSADYLAVKDEMETLSAAHISHEEFVRVCERHGVSDAKDQDTLLDLLHDLGTVLYFRDADGNPLLPALGVLNPNWVTRGVYLIVTNPALKDKYKGKLSKAYLREILSAPEYSRHIEDIAKLLERFELCYRADDSSYWLPSLMAKEIDEDLGNLKSSAMKFEYGYPELPKSVIVRFIVKTHARILDNKVWRSGVVLRLDGNTALVQADEEDKCIRIFISGEESTRRDALAILRAHFDDIHTMFATPPEAFIYPPQYPNVQLRFDKMKNLLKTGTTQIPELDGDKPVTINLRELLDGFVTPQERHKDEEREKRGDTYITNNNITMGNMHGSSLTLGDGNTSTVSVQNSFNTFPAELQNTLTELMKASETLLQKAEESEHTEEIKDELESLQTEAKKSKPKKERIKVTVEGLAQAAKNLNEIGKPVLELAMTVIKLINNLPA